MTKTIRVLISSIFSVIPLAVSGAAFASTTVDECSAKPPEWVFCSGFEEGNKSSWDDYDGNPDSTNLLMPDPGPFNLADNHVMRLRAPLGPGGADLVKVLPGSYDRVYARWYIKYEPGFDFTAGNHGGGLHAGDRNLLGRSGYRPDGTNWFSAAIQHDRFYAYTYYRGMYQDCADPNGSCWGDSFPCVYDSGQSYCKKPQHRGAAPSLVADRWYCAEMMMDAGTPVTSDSLANGTLALWIDEQIVGSWNDLWLRTTPNLKLTTLWLNLFHGGNHSVEGVLLDNVVVSTQRVGCARTDVLPRAPQNLQVQ